MIDTYNKLVRDKIPEIIRQKGDMPTTEILDDDITYANALYRKLTEEYQEFMKNHDIEELADMLEVIYAIAKHKGVSLDDLERIRLQKRKERGGFDDKVILLEVLRNPDGD